MYVRLKNELTRYILNDILDICGKSNFYNILAVIFTPRRFIRLKEPYCYTKMMDFYYIINYIIKCQF